MAMNAHIVLVEDDGFLASIYAERMEAEGWQVSLATNGEDGLKLVRKEQPSLVLLDLVLPRLDGFSVLKELKNDAKTKAIPVLIFTNLGQREDIERCHALGCAGYIVKAHTLPQEAIARIQEILA